MSKIETITLRQHQALAGAIERADGQVDCGDNGVLKSLIRRGWAGTEGGKGIVLITELGRWMHANATIDPKSCPTSMDLTQFQKYVRSRGKEPIGLPAHLRPRGT